MLATTTDDASENFKYIILSPSFKLHGDYSHPFYFLGVGNFTGVKLLETTFKIDKGRKMIPYPSYKTYCFLKFSLSLSLWLR